MNSRKIRPWMVLAFVGIVIPLIYFAVWDRGPSFESASALALERSTASASILGRESQEHELAALAQELEKNPDHTPVLLRMAQLERDLGRPAESARYLRSALEVEPENGDARLELGRVLYESGDLDGAIAQTTRLLEQDPENVDALYNLGAIYGNMMDDARAKELWERAVSLDPGSQSGRRAASGLKRLSVVAPPGELGQSVAVPDDAP